MTTREFQVWAQERRNCFLAFELTMSFVWAVVSLHCFYLWNEKGENGLALIDVVNLILSGQGIYKIWIWRKSRGLC